ncbi:MAG: hypothetical protein KC620_23710 [Myxococcales bacterium]|nr:hypothetical protein [Myxococcales bacterium]
MRRFFWDYYGPQAAGTAAHFHRHLDEFLAREGLLGCTTGTETYAPMHAAAWCEAPAEVAEVVARALRPRRSDP